MTAITTARLTPDPQRFPPGTAVSAYRSSAWSGHDRSVPPTGAADVGPVAVAADGSLTFTGLTDQQTYFAWAAGTGAPVRFSTRHDAADDLSGPGSVNGVQLVGADATGVTDSTAAFQAAHAAAVAGGTNVLVSPGTYTVSGRLHGAAATTSPVRFLAVIPGTVTIQRSAAVPMIEVVGTKSATVALSTDLVQGGTLPTVASLPPGGLQADDYVELNSTVLFATGIGATAATVAEIARVKSVVGTGPYTITLYGPTDEGYTVANGSTIARYDAAGSGSYLHGITFRQTAQNRDDAQFPLVRFNVARNVTIDTCRFRDADVPGIELKGTVNADIDRCHFENLTDNTGSGFIGYGINLGGNCRDIRITRPVGRWVRHVVTTGWGTGDVGVPRHIVIAHGQSYETSGGGLSTHKEGKYITIDSWSSHADNNYGIYVRNPHTTIINPTIVCPGASNSKAGIKVAENESPDCLIVGGRIVLGPNSFSGVHTESARTTVVGTTVVGPGSGANFKIEALGTESAFVDVRSREPNGSAHFNYARDAGGGHVIQGGVLSSAAAKQVVSSGGGTTAIEVTGGPRGTNLTSYGNQVGLSTENRVVYALKAANYTLGDFDGTVGFDTTAAGRIATLPDATKCINRTFVIKNVTGANSVTLAATSAQTIDGAAPATVLTAGQVARFQSNGANWITV